MSDNNVSRLFKETQFKRKNPIFLGFSFAYFFLLMVLATGAYSMMGDFLFKMAVVAAQYDVLVPLVDNFGIAPFFLIYAIIPILFLIIRLNSKITVELTEDKLIFKDYYIFLVGSYTIDVSEIESVSMLKIKQGEHKVDFFSQKAFSFKKVLFVYGRNALKLTSNLIKKDTIIMGSQRSKEWLETYKLRGIQVKQDFIGEVTPIPKVETKKVPTTQPSKS